MERTIKLNWSIKFIIKFRFYRKLLRKYNQDRGKYTEKQGYNSAIYEDTKMYKFIKKHHLKNELDFNPSNPRFILRHLSNIWTSIIDSWVLCFLVFIFFLKEYFYQAEYLRKNKTDYMKDKEIIRFRSKFEIFLNMIFIFPAFFLSFVFGEIFERILLTLLFLIVDCLMLSLKTIVQTFILPVYFICMILLVLKFGILSFLSLIGRLIPKLFMRKGKKHGVIRIIR